MQNNEWINEKNRMKILIIKIRTFTSNLDAKIFVEKNLGL